MSLPAFLEGRLSLPLIGSPLFIISQPALVIAQCRAGIVGSFPSLNARPSGMFEQWLQQLGEALTDRDAPFAVNLIVHKTNSRLEEDLALCVKYRVPIVITSLGAREDVNRAVHSYGGIVLHDVINNGFARKAIQKGADGLIAVAAGAGGHAGTMSPFALVEEIRAWFDGPLALSGAIATGRSIAAARMMGADFAYMGSPFIATQEANAEPAYKQMIVDSGAADIVYSDYFTGVLGNYLRPSITAAGLDADNLPKASEMDFSSAAGGAKKAWRDVWGAGQGIGAIRDIQPAGDFIAQLKAEYRAAIAAFAA
ncbi:2-nitropropane dioxygenase [Sphingobium sp. TA15]|uniref:2-nitropropane dioxygenase family protein n=2 Tax=Sphingobium indicum TaxID=332055 RepID=D4Z337_SPHIU|nr:MULTISPECIES: nitronate monooxygenase family protein [Sphingobium]EPR14520.1 2-nitropropane dioxygenase [Sphingobium indicum IP26]BDD66448.1 2-nitropropane dioxygenase [Sphingobium sp. TA15]EQB07543.1 2-nitropropane dioxygenase [Sphingobium sp. HDIP04]KER34872.1 2-nitropropane dioxygenase [Sphingobium indicum F2]KER36859.1 2-nitropropane dioxygenase [Sphingobium indicum F2]